MLDESVGRLPTPGQRLGAYEVLGEIAHGGMAAVYLARKRFEVAGLDKLVALKVLLPHLRDREFMEMFLDEARVALAIAHPHVVQVIDVAESDGVPYIVMEYLRGQSLGATARRERELGSERDALVFQILAQAAAGVHAAHETLDSGGRSLGIVHRDVTPSNIHVGYDGCVKLVDFGIAASRGRITATRPNVLKGTFHYLAPEQITRSCAIDRRVDLWALGVIGWELLAGKPLFRAETEATTLWNVLNTEIPDLRQLAPRISESVATRIMACLSRDPARRPESAQVLEDAFGAAARDAGLGTARELSSVMTRLFAAEQTRDEAKLAATTRTTTRGERMTTSGVPTSVARRQRRPRFAVAIGAVLFAAAGATAVVLAGARDDAAPISTQPVAPPPASPLQPPAAVLPAPASSAAAQPIVPPPAPTPPAEHRIRRKAVRVAKPSPAVSATPAARVAPAATEPTRRGSQAPLLDNPYR